jgi:hypothetical protein
MSVKFEIDFKSKEFEFNLRLLSLSIGDIAKETIKNIGRDMVAEARSRARAAFISRTGKLIRHIKFIPTDSGGAFTTRKTLKEYKSDAFYSLFIEKGTDMRLRRRKRGKGRKVISTGMIRPRPFMGPVYDEYWNGPSSKGWEAIQRALQNKMDKL